MCECHREIHRLMMQLLVERQRVCFMRQILDQKFGLILSDDGSDDIINAICLRFGGRPGLSRSPRELEVHATCQKSHAMPEKSADEHKKKDERKFKAPPRTVQLAEEQTEEEIAVHVRNGEGIIAEMRARTFGDMDTSVANTKIHNILTLLENSYKKAHMDELRKQRACFQSIYTLERYTEMVYDHILKVSKLLEDKKGDKKGIEASIRQMLTTVEMRLVQYQGFEKTVLDPDDIEKLRFCLYISADHPKTHRVFEHEHFHTFFRNYSLAIFPVRDVLEIYVNNPYGFYNIMHLQTGDTDYRFYTLSKIDGEKRYWSMDCRLDSLIHDLSVTVREFAAQLFRRMYRVCAKTNAYIPEYGSKFPLLEADGEQLIRNIILTLNYREFGDMVRSRVRERSSAPPTHLDKFDLLANDPEVARAHENEKLTQEEVFATLRFLFDSITDAQCTDFCTKRGIVF